MIEPRALRESAWALCTHRQITLCTAQGLQAMTSSDGHNTEREDLDTIVEPLRTGRLVVVSGAGISAESGIPTFRGKDGYWQAGGIHYHPQELATFSAFSKEPKAVWSWYIYRHGVCTAAKPNDGHRALATMEKLLGDRFRLITQNVDGLHVRAGNSPERTYQIHGNISRMRCREECTPKTYALPEGLSVPEKNGTLSDDDFAKLKCPACGNPSRPHVLWFDEVYDETLFRAQSSIQAADACDVLIVVGSSGSTNLPAQVAQRAAKGEAIVVDINPDAGPFAQIAMRSGGFWLKGSASQWLSKISAQLQNLLQG